MGAKKPKSRKPTGAMGSVRIRATGESASVEFLPVSFPKTKEEIEQQIVDAFVRAAAAVHLREPLLDLQQSPQDDFDFYDAAASRPTYVELMEVAPLENLGGYDKAPESYKPYDFAEYIFAKMLGKSGRYRVSPKARLVLLIYITDWRFTLSETIVSLLQYWTLKQDHVFSEIYAYSPVGSGDGIPHLIYPTPEDFWRAFDPEAYRENVTYNLDPTAFQVSFGDG